MKTCTDCKTQFDNAAEYCPNCGSTSQQNLPGGILAQGTLIVVGIVIGAIAAFFLFIFIYTIGAQGGKITVILSGLVGVAGIGLGIAALVNKRFWKLHPLGRSILLGCICGFIGIALPCELLLLPSLFYTP